MSVFQHSLARCSVTRVSMSAPTAVSKNRRTCRASWSARRISDDSTCLDARNLEDQYGIKSNEIRWRSGGQEEAERDERTPEAPEGLDLKPIPEDRTLVEMFEAGELDALTTAREPSFTLRKPNIGRLFPDFRTAEKQYYEETDLSIMHLMGLRKDLAEKHPWLRQPLQGFRRGPRYRTGYRKDGRAWRRAAMGGGGTPDTVDLMGPDYWKYGIENAAMRLRHWLVIPQRRLSERLLTPEDYLRNPPSIFSESDHQGFAERG